MAAGFAFGARDARRDRFGIDPIFFAAILTGDFHDSPPGRSRCLRDIWTQRYGIAAGFALGAGNSRWNLVKVHIVDFFTF